jgi:hypothetical protein
MWGQIAMAGANLLGGILGNSAERKQLRLQREEFEFQKKMAEEQLALAKEAHRMGMATQVDAAGNITAYDPATNTWKTILSADQQQLLDASERESLLQLTRDAGLARSEREASARDRIADRGVADTLRSQIADQISGRSGLNPTDMANSLRLAREQAVSQGFDDVSNTLSLQAIRSGAGGLDRIGNALGRARAQAIAQTMGNPELEGRQLAEQFNQQRLGTNANLYNMFATRASNPNAVAPNVSTDPGTASLNAARSAAMGGLGAAGNLTGSAASIRGSANLPAIDNTWGELFTGIGNILGSPIGQQGMDWIGGLFKRTPTSAASGGNGLAGGGVY